MELRVPVVSYNELRNIAYAVKWNIESWNKNLEPVWAFLEDLSQWKGCLVFIQG